MLFNDDVLFTAVIWTAVVRENRVQWIRGNCRCVSRWLLQVTMLVVTWRDWEKNIAFLSRDSWCPEIRTRCLSNIGEINLWHACTNWHAESFLGTRHSLLCQFIFTSFARPASMCCEEYVCTHISDCVEIAYELPLLPNNTASETLLHKSGAVRTVYCIFIIGASAWRWLG